MAFLTLFPTFVYQNRLTSGARLNQLRKNLARESLILAEIDEDGIEWSRKNYRNGFTSYGSLDTLHEQSPHFADLAKLLNRHVTVFARKQAWDLQGGALKLVSMWVNVMPPNTVHSLHLHPHSVVSGTFYVNTPSGTSPIKFEDPRMDRFMAQPMRLASAPKSQQAFYQCEPRAGDVILFESWLRHEVPQTPPPKSARRNQSKQRQNGTRENADLRISISFNFDWR